MAEGDRDDVLPAATMALATGGPALADWRQAEGSGSLPREAKPSAAQAVASPSRVLLLQELPSVDSRHQGASPRSNE